MREKELKKYRIHLSNEGEITYTSTDNLISVIDKFTSDDGIFINNGFIFKHQIVKITEVK